MKRTIIFGGSSVLMRSMVSDAGVVVSLFIGTENLTLKSTSRFYNSTLQSLGLVMIQSFIFMQDNAPFIMRRKLVSFGGE